MFIIKNILEQVAKNNGVSKEMVKQEIEKAIDEAMKNRDQNEFSKKFWDSVSKNGERPTAEEFIAALTLITLSKQ